MIDRLVEHHFGRPVGRAVALVEWRLPVLLARMLDRVAAGLAAKKIVQVASRQRGGATITGHGKGQGGSDFGSGCGNGGGGLSRSLSLGLLGRAEAHREGGGKQDGDTHDQSPPAADIP